MSDLDRIYGDVPRAAPSDDWTHRTTAPLEELFLDEKEPASSERRSWQPVDLLALELDPPSPPTIVDLFYPGRRHVLSGEPETLKTWVALIACASEIGAGRRVIYVDFENGGASMIERLRARLALETTSCSAFSTSCRRSP